MITKESITKDVNEIRSHLNKFYHGLEDLWGAAMNRDYDKVTRFVDRLQNLGDDCLSHIKFHLDMLEDDAYKLLKILDKNKELRMMDDAMEILDDIKGRIEFWEKKKSELNAYNSGDFVDEDKE